jgi:hypothetical protein
MPILWRVFPRYADEFEGHSLGDWADCLHAEKDFVVLTAGRAPEIVKRQTGRSHDSTNRSAKRHRSRQNGASGEQLYFPWSQPDAG